MKSQFELFPVPKAVNSCLYVFEQRKSWKQVIFILITLVLNYVSYVQGKLENSITVRSYWGPQKQGLFHTLHNIWWNLSFRYREENSGLINENKPRNYTMVRQSNIQKCVYWQSYIIRRKYSIRRIKLRVFNYKKYFT